MHRGNKYKIVKIQNNKGFPERRIKALRDGQFFSKGDIGAIIDDDSSLSQEDESWATYSSRLINTKIGGSSLLITGSSLSNCSLFNINGTVHCSEVIGLHVESISNYPSSLDITDSHLAAHDKIKLSKHFAIKLSKVSIRCKYMRMSGHIDISDSKIGDDTMELTDLSSVSIHNSEISDSKLLRPDIINGSSIRHSTIYGPAQLSNCEITNSTLDYNGKPFKADDDTPDNRVYYIGGLYMTGSKAVLHSCDEIHMLDYVDISDMELFDLAETIVRNNEDAMVVRVPGRKWFIELADRNYFDRKTQSLPGCTTDSLVRFLNRTKSKDARLAKTVLDLCIQACRNPVDRGDELKLRWLLMTFGIRTRIKKLFSL